MRRSYSIVIPTGNRQPYLGAALSDLIGQEFPADRYDIFIVDDTEDGANRELVLGAAAGSRVPVRYLRRVGPQGINAARNTGVRASRGDVIAFVDDDCRFHKGWLAALDRGVEGAPRADCFGGPIEVSLEQPHPRWCGRDPFPITWLERGPADRYVDVVFGANFAVRRSALERLGLFDEDHLLYGDEVEWMFRLRRSGGLVRYVAGARVLHTRLPNDVKLRQLMRGALVKGRNIAAFDIEQGIAQPLPAVLRRTFRWAAHAAVYRCWSAATHALQTSAYAFYSIRAARS